MTQLPKTDPVVPPSVFQRMVDVRRDLHQNPELSWHEERTASVVCAALDQIGISYESGVAKTGIVAEIPGNGGKRIALRADMDALPIQEETKLEFASSNPGVMHACGHDGHTSILLGAAELLVQSAPLPMPVRLIFQPAEEVGAGAKAMVEAGVLDDVDMIFGGHIDRQFVTGEIVVTEGPVNASTDTFRITVTGRGTHAARPHEGIDAVVVGSALVMSLQTIVSREVNPAHPSVITVGRFDAGTASNVLAGRAVLEGTIRAQSADVRNYLVDSIHRTASAVADLHNTQIDVEVTAGTPVLDNTREMTRLARAAATQTVGADNITELTHANMGGEDFAYYLEHRPGCYVRFGSVMAGVENHPAHTNQFDFDEKVMAVAAAYYYQLIHEAARAVAETEHLDRGQ